MELSVIQSKIQIIRGYKVLLDFDLAPMYEIENKYLKRAVRHNITRFEGDDFMFELTKEELSRCKIGTLNNRKGGNIKYAPFAFTELGVAMLSSVLNSDTAIEINRKIMRAFVAIRQYVLNYSELKHELDNFMRETNAKFDNNDMKFDALFELFDEYIAYKKELEKPRNPIGFRTSANS
jgi:hypothetical protein